MDKVKETRDRIKDVQTILTADEHEATLAKNLSGKGMNDRQVLAAIRQQRANKAREKRNSASYSETITLKAIIDSVRGYRSARAKTHEEVDRIMSDNRYSSGHKTELVNEANKKLRTRANDEKEAVFTLINDIIKDRQNYDKAFFTDPERLETANRVIGVLKNAGSNISIEDFVNLTEPLYGDTAAARYVFASIKDMPVIYKGVIESMAVSTESVFNESRQQLDNLFGDKFAAYGVEKTLLDAASSVGVSLDITDYSEPIYSENRNVSLEAEIPQDEILATVREIMGVQRKEN